MCIVNINKLIELRKRAKLTQRELANLLKLSPDEIGKLERDEIGDPKISTVVKYVDYFDVDIYWLLDRDKIGFISKIERKILNFIRHKKINVDALLLHMERIETPDLAIPILKQIHNKIVSIKDEDKAKAIWIIVKDM